MNQVPLYIFDLDGTLANCEHRVHLLDEKDDPDRWRKFYADCCWDQPINPVIKVMDKLNMFADVQIWTGRSDEVREKTISWLVEHTGFMQHDIKNALVMRQAGDHRPDHELKREWLDQLSVYDRKRISVVFEDRDRVVAMWREAGVPCFQVAPGSF